MCTTQALQAGLIHPNTGKSPAQLRNPITGTNILPDSPTGILTTPRIPTGYEAAKSLMDATMGERMSRTVADLGTQTFKLPLPTNE